MSSHLTTVREQAAVVEAGRVALRDAIVLAHESGERAAAIAEASGYTRQRVYQIIGEQPEREAAMRSRLKEIDARWESMIGKMADGRPGDYKAVTAIQNAGARKLARKGLPRETTVAEAMRDVAETGALRFLEENRGVPVVEKIIRELDEAAALRKRLTALDETRGFGHVID